MQEEMSPVNTDEPEYATIVAERRVLEIQAKLHRWARDDPHRRFDDLFNLVADPAFLLVAWDRVRGNKGARTAGVDGRTAMSIEVWQGVEDFLDELRSALKDRSFTPLPVRERMIPKAGGKLRRLGIATIRDRVAQASVKLVLEPIFEADFLPCSYGFRPNRRAHDAVAEVRLLTSKGYEWIVEGDIKACFDEISHPALMGRVRARVGDKRVLALVKAFLKAGILSEDGALRDNDTGTPQGSILTPPTQLAISVLRSRWVTGGWSVAGDGRAGAGRAGRGGAARVCTGGGAGRDLGGRAGRDRAGRLGPAGRGLAGRAGRQHGADHRVVGRAVTGSRTGPVLIGGAGVPVTPLDISGCIFMACLGGWIARSTPSGSTRLLIWWGRACLRRRPRAALPGGSGARSARPAGMWARPSRVARWRCPSRAWCSPSSCRGGWLRRSASMPGGRGAPSPRW
jgi:RNA-directed DNA polymerase